jgi:hypothetical protein
VLARLDRTAAQLALQAAQNTYDAAVAARDEPTTTTQNGTTTQQQSDEQLELAVAEAAVDLATAKDDYAATTIVAPRAAVVDSVAISVGATPPSDSAAIVLRSAGMQVSIDVAEDDIVAVKRGQHATVHLIALDQDVPGVVTTIDADDSAAAASSSASSSPSGSGGGSSSSSVVTYPVGIRLGKVPAGLRTGMTAEVTIVTASRTDVITVPLTAVLGSGENARVRVPGAGGRSVETKQVTLGLLTSSTAEVVAGIDEGDEVVTGIVAPKEDSAQDGQPGSSALGGTGAGGLGGGGFGGPPGGFAGGPPPGFGGNGNGGAARSGAASGGGTQRG